MKIYSAFVAEKVDLVRSTVGVELIEILTGRPHVTAFAEAVASVSATLLLELILRKLVEELPGLPQCENIESLRKPIVDIGQHCTSFGATVLRLQPLGE